MAINILIKSDFTTLNCYNNLMSDKFSYSELPYEVPNYHDGKSAKLLMYDFCVYIGDTIRRGKIWEPWLHKAFEQYIKPTDVVLEAGCHVGSHSVKLSKLADRVLCFEPMPTSNEILKKNLEINGCNNVIVSSYGLADHSGKTKFKWIPDGNVGGSGLEGTTDEWPWNVDEVKPEDIKVELITIDSLKLKKLDFIKMDVEGYEPLVIKGGIKTIKKLKPIIVLEVRIEGATVKDATDRFPELIELGYTCKHLHYTDFIFLP
jgi:FkbM family methyltransferase